MSNKINEANKRLIEQINQVEENYKSNFSNTQKILLTTDGSITAILDVLYGKITLSTLEQHFEKATEEVSNLVNVEKGEEVNYREVIMHKGDKQLIYALSYIPLKRLDDNFKSDLIRADVPIGRILKNYNIESRREVKNIQVEKTTPKLTKLFKTNDDVLTRDYNIIKNGEILIWIKEIFPVSYFLKV